MQNMLIALALMVGLVGGCSRKATGPHNPVLLGAQSDALAAKIVLTELRDGRLTNALELLEQQIDSSIIAIDSRLAKLPEHDRETAIGVLESLKAYRVAHPRRQEAVIPDVEYEAMIQKAAQVLSQLK